MSNCNFSYKHYEELMERIKEKGYKDKFFYEPEEDKMIIIRHDIDQDLDYALKLAKIENMHGIKSNYFIWLNSPFYNIFEARSFKLINELVNLGHDIGIHFDESSYNIKNEADLNQYLKIEAEIIKLYYGIDVKSVSFHRPSKIILENDVTLNGYINTYSQKYIKEYKYISDSRGIWREGCLCNLLKNNDYNKIQVLMHAIWWGRMELSPQKHIMNFVGYKMSRLEQDLSMNISTFHCNDAKL